MTRRWANIAALMPEHPARAILHTGSPGKGGSALLERCLSQCWMPSGSAVRSACEQIESRDAMPRWATCHQECCRSRSPICCDFVVRSKVLCGDAGVQKQLANWLSQIVVDSGTPFRLPRQSSLQIGGRVRRGMTVADLAGLASHAGRETLARNFDNPVSRPGCEYSGGSRCVRLKVFRKWWWGAICGLWGARCARRRRESSQIDEGGDAGAGRLARRSLARFSRFALACEGDALAVTVADITTAQSLPRPSEYLPDARGRSRHHVRRATRFARHAFLRCPYCRDLPHVKNRATHDHERTLGTTRTRPAGCRRGLRAPHPIACESPVRPGNGGPGGLRRLHPQD